MDYGEQYLTYREYVKMGGKLEQAPFNIFEYEARKKIDKRTQDRLVDSNDVPDEVRFCIFKLIDLMSKYDERLNKINNVKNETIDGYSVHYTTDDDVKNILENKNNEIEDVISDCLTGVIYENNHLLYLGVGNDN